MLAVLAGLEESVEQAGSANPAALAVCPAELADRAALAAPEALDGLAALEVLEALGGSVAPAGSAALGKLVAPAASEVPAVSEEREESASSEE